MKITVKKKSKREYDRDYYKKNAEKIKENQKKYVEMNREKVNARILKYKKTVKGKYSEYKSNASKRGLTFNLTLEEFKQFWSGKCYYCGDKISSVGIDRRDSAKGYTENNLVCCCSICNSMKSNMSLKDFINKCKQICELQ